jgi:hypothetical protein
MSLSIRYHVCDMMLYVHSIVELWSIIVNYLASYISINHVIVTNGFKIQIKIIGYDIQIHLH